MPDEINLIRDFTTILDEAFGLLLENIWNVWIKMIYWSSFQEKRCSTTGNTTEETTNRG